ncbi:MAG: hypothetical protein R3B98_10035 [Hyphomonas sp.]
MFTPRPAALAASAALIGILLIAACASRQPPRGGPPGAGPQAGGPGRPGAEAFDGGIIARPVALLFTSMDTNQDRIVDEQEIADGIAAEWASLPQSSRGTVPALEIADWAAGALGNAEALPNQIAFDTNLDGQITEAEFRTRLAEEFDRLDKNQDGRLARSEMIATVAVRMASGPGGGMPGGDRSGGGRPPPR